MMERILSVEQGRQMQTLLDDAQRIVLTCHVGPDGDAIGSTTAMSQILRRYGKDVSIVVPNEFPDFLKWIPCAGSIICYEKNKERAIETLQQADLLIMMDYSRSGRVGEEMECTIGQLSQPRIIIDHHLDPDPNYCNLLISRPEMCSACEVLLRVSLDMGWADELKHDEAVSIYTGMMTDTGAFTYASSRAEVYEAISILLRTGIDKDKIYRNVFWVSSFDRMRLMGYMLYVKLQRLAQGKAYVMTLTNAERKHFSLKNGDTEGFVNLPLEIYGARLSIFLREDTDTPGLIRVSLRSVDDFPCNEMAAQFFDGGGHKNASGGRLKCTMDEAIEVVKKGVKAFSEKL